MGHTQITRQSARSTPWADRVWNLTDDLDEPLRRRSWRGRRVLVNPTGDLFDEAVSPDYIARVFAVMALCPEVTFQVLTHRPERLRSLMSEPDVLGWDLATTVEAALPHPYVFDARVDNPAFAARHERLWRDGKTEHRRVAFAWPLPNVWLGVRVEDQDTADRRIPALLDTPAAVRFLSCEPLLGPVDLQRATAAHRCLRHECAWCVSPNIDWVIVGGESGPGARPMHPDWARSLRDQCAAAGVPFFFNQWGEWAPDHAGRKPDAKDPKSLVLHRSGMTALTPDNPFDPWERGHPGWHTVMRRVGKKAAGRMLDGRTHDEFPGDAT